MANLIQLKRSSTAGAAPSSLADGEVAVQQADGALFWRNSAAAVRRMLLPKRAPVANVAYTIKATDTYVGISSLTATRTLTLPAASAYPEGHALAIVDESGACSPTVGVLVIRAGTDTVNGTVILTLTVPRFSIVLTSDGVSKWTASGFGLPMAGDGAAITVTPTGGTARSLPDALAPTLSLGLARAAIPSVAIPLSAFTVNGYAAAGDGGQDATYIRGTSGGLMAIQDKAGTWWNLFLGGAIVRPGWFGAVGSGNVTAALQACDVAATAAGLPYSLHGTYSVSMFKPSQGAVIYAACTLNGNATVATDCILDLSSSLVTIIGRLGVDGQLNTNYQYGFWYRGSQTQYIFSFGLSVARCKKAGAVGSTAKPSGIVSESTFYNIQTYCCPGGIDVIGVETIVSFIGCHISADRFGMPAGSPFEQVPVRGITCTGGNVAVIGGELICTSLTNGALVEMQPLGGSSEGVRWGEVRVIGACIESASPFAALTNPSGLTINSTFNTRGKLLFSGCSGFYSQDSSAAVFDTTPTYDGTITFTDNNLNYPGNRSQPNISLLSSKADVYFGASPFGPGFNHPLSGTFGGIVHFEDRLVLDVQDISGQALATGANNVLLYKSADVVNDGLGRFSAYYAASTGTFTVPPGGLYGIEVEVQFVAPALVDGFIGIFQNGSQVAQAGITKGCGFVRYVAGYLPAGVALQAFVNTLNTATTGHPTAFLNSMTIKARNSQ